MHQYTVLPRTVLSKRNTVCATYATLNFLLITVNMKNKQMKLILMTYLTQYTWNIILTLISINIINGIFYILFFIVCFQNQGYILHLQNIISMQTSRTSSTQEPHRATCPESGGTVSKPKSIIQRPEVLKYISISFLVAEYLLHIHPPNSHFHDSKRNF